MKRLFCLVLALLLCLTACGSTAPAQQELYAMDTYITLRVWGRDRDEAITEVTQFIYGQENQLSVTKSASAIARLNANGSAELSPEVFDLLEQSQALSRRTGGALDITMYPLVRLWGFTTGEYRVPGPSEIGEAAALCGSDRLTLENGRAVLSPGSMVDLGAVAKGWAGTRAAELLSGLDIDCTILSLGGSIQTYGTKPDGSDWEIAIQSPFEEGQLLGSLFLSGTAAVVTSGGYQRYFTKNGKTYCHIIDPATGSPAESGLASVTVVAEDGLLADGLSTALYIMGLDKAAGHWRQYRDFEAVFVTDGGEIYITAGLEGRCALGEARVIQP